FISLFLLLFVDLLGLKKESYVTVAAVVIGAVLFGLYHLPVASNVPIGAMDTPWVRFIERVPMGVLWSIAYIYRGFGIAVGGHVAWNIFVNIYW
ncbi:MAG TPA: CPBP family intramembrane metalloprotease, partial [Phycisphaerae bacterium]|nr:CPBP family intramembrane metalloprotease [Phycisphaerae bacterium]